MKKDGMAGVMVRHAENDFEALQVAQGMENAGAKVFSINRNTVSGILQYYIWAKIENEETTTDLVDDEIDKIIEG